MARDIDKALLEEIKNETPLNRAYRRVQSFYPRNSFEEILAEKEGNQLTSTPANATYTETKGLPPLPRETQPLVPSTNKETLQPDPKAFELGKKIAAQDPEGVAKAIEEANAWYGAKQGQSSKDEMNRYYSIMADKERRFKPYIDPMKQGMARLEDLIDNYKGQTSGVSMKPLAALADSWSKSAAGSFREMNLSQGVESAPDPKQRALANVGAEKIGQEERDRLLDSVIKAYQAPDGLGGKGGSGNRDTSMFMRGLIKDTLPIGKSWEGVSASMTDLRDAMESGDAARITSKLESLQRNVNNVKGAGTEGDVARAMMLDLQDKWKVAMQKANIEERVKYQKETIAPLLEAIEVKLATAADESRKNMASVIEAYKYRDVAEGLGLMQEGAPGYNLGQNAISKIDGGYKQLQEKRKKDQKSATEILKQRGQ